MGVFGPNSTPQIQPTVKQTDRSHPDAQRKNKDQKKKEDEEGKRPARDADSVQVKGAKDIGSQTPKQAVKPAGKHIDFSA